MLNNQIKNFNESRTPFFKSLLFLIIESIIPGLTIWFCVGFDFNFSLTSKLPYPNVGYVSLICTVYFLYSFLITYLFYKFKFHEADMFTFSSLITLILIILILFGSFMNTSGIWIFVRFIAIVAFVIIATPFFVFISVLFRNKENKKIEDYERALEAYKKGEIIPSNKLLRAQRYQSYLIKKQNKIEELKNFKIELDEKITKELQEQELKRNLKMKKIIDKLDQKEEKQRQKKQKD
ncbi:DxFTY motif-containing membrane protein [Spiroplasma endosymbiont of Cantharis lateralis]|uniref:DxFTY motif-containing membrane protein n=1 Tax=Spiroplasma endosymbiont of Cantharis lateralis TaxID=3066277 RepID=UPI00313EEC9C